MRCCSVEAGVECLAVSCGGDVWFAQMSTCATSLGFGRPPSRHTFAPPSPSPNPPPPLTGTYTKGDSCCLSAMLAICKCMTEKADNSAGYSTTVTFHPRESRVAKDQKQAQFAAESMHSLPSTIWNVLMQQVASKQTY